MTVTELALPDDLTRRYDELAEEDARVAEAIAAVERGEWVDAEEIHAEDEILLAQLGLPPEQLAAIKAEVEREADVFYGVSLCE